MVSALQEITKKKFSVGIESVQNEGDHIFFVKLAEVKIYPVFLSSVMLPLHLFDLALNR